MSFQRLKLLDDPEGSFDILRFKVNSVVYRLWYFKTLCVFLAPSVSVKLLTKF
uniref:Uncharacterized protein n=1 Tax=Nothobranchius furzeri TaxID=105023 RepID=A0A8C6MBM6_NOTFU